MPLCCGLEFIPPSIERNEAENIPETELRVVNSGTTYYGCEEVNEITYFFLLNAHGDTLAWQFEPFENVKGIVYMQKKGVYDCRSTTPILLVEDASNALGASFHLKAVEGKDEVLILNLKTSREFLYDLENKVLSVK